MKLTENLIEQVDNTATKEEAGDAITKDGMNITCPQCGEDIL